VPRAHRSSRSAAPGPRRQPLRNPRRNFDANKNSGNSRAFSQHADATGRFACCRARRWRHPGARTRACPQAEKNFSRHAPFRHRTRANAQNCANFFALFGACERACAAPRSASPPRRRCRCSVRMSAHAPHRHITHTRPDASRVLLPPRPLPSACLASTDPQHRARAPRRTHPTGRTRRRWPTLAAAQQALLRSADAAPATPDCDAHHRHCQKTGATFAASRHRCSGAAFEHMATASCAAIRAARPASAAWRGASGACVASARRDSAHADMPIARVVRVDACGAAGIHRLVRRIRRLRCVRSPLLRPFGDADRPIGKRRGLSTARSASCRRFRLCRTNENRPHKAAGSDVATWGSAQWPSSSSSSA